MVGNQIGSLVFVRAIVSSPRHQLSSVTARCRGGSSFLPDDMQGGYVFEITLVCVVPKETGSIRQLVGGLVSVTACPYAGESSTLYRWDSKLLRDPGAAKNFYVVPLGGIVRVMNIKSPKTIMEGPTRSTLLFTLQS